MILIGSRQTKRLTIRIGQISNSREFDINPKGIVKHYNYTFSKKETDNVVNIIRSFWYVELHSDLEDLHRGQNQLLQAGPDLNIFQDLFDPLFRSGYGKPHVIPG